MIDIQQAIQGQLRAALWECAPPAYTRQVLGTHLLEEVAGALVVDARAYAEKDPASSGAPLVVVQACTSFRAVVHYRLARALIRSPALGDHTDTPVYSALISSRGKLLSGADIHHRCSIGQRFVIDHGVGTVIGETAVIGDDCYILGGVTLGASGIADNPRAKRHPTLGNRVQVGAFAQIFGPIHVGDDVFIGPHCTVTHDVAARSRVVLQSRVQVIRAGAGSVAETA